MLIAPVVLSRKVSLAVPGTAAGGVRVALAVGSSGSGLTAGVADGEEGGTTVASGVAEEAMEGEWVCVLDKFVTVV